MKLEWYKIIFISEITDYVKSDNSYVFLKILSDIIKWVYKNVTIIFQHQPNFPLPDEIINSENLLIFDVDKLNGD